MDDTIRHENFPGVTPPISTVPPKESELEATRELEAALRGEKGQFESEEETRRREKMLGRLSQLVKEFVYKISIANKMPEVLAREAGGKIFTFGSFRLGVYNAGSDIDTLVVVPKHVKREDFFTTMYELLRETKDVTELTKIEDAYVPLIAMVFSGVDIDLTFASINHATVPPDLDLRDDNILTNLDERCVRSLNGSRVTDEILRLVPDVLAFRLSLKCIKLWAKNRAIYGNVVGFFGGIAWTMLVVRICQLYPRSPAGTIVSRFFRIMFKWPWPQPVLLKEIEDGPLQVRVWNPMLYPSDRNHRMPIITPAYPSICATHNVMQSTQAIMTAEFKRGDEIVEKIAAGKAKWEDLWAKHDFYHRYKHYLQIVASSESEEVQLKWGGMVESRIRQLIMKLETIDSIRLVHPFIKGTEKNYPCKTSNEREQAKKGIFISDSEAEPDKSCTMYTTSFYLGLSVKPMKGQKKLDLSLAVQQFRETFKGWEHFDKEEAFLEVVNVKGANLPKELRGEDPFTPKPLERKRPNTDGNDNTDISNSDGSPRKIQLPNPTENSADVKNGMLSEELREDPPPQISSENMSKKPKTDENDNMDITNSDDPSKKKERPNPKEDSTNIKDGMLSEGLKRSDIDENENMDVASSDGLPKNKQRPNIKDDSAVAVGSGMIGSPMKIDG